MLETRGTVMLHSFIVSVLPIWGVILVSGSLLWYLSSRDAS